ncbi:hypothetical protein [Streptomyces sp. NEAU-S7GS2]|uniref:hypothetical protein n=1 Tax=Streptomyces sp. NEAU-S7GS2 TaxID=2202000 RepID=UPI000D704732|nr:hypothetical protein [Streptomyces sp. NEAU-S7GS2]AWN28570.1 hypothetical protein DKG71_22755 [Streptomyces sp. NEAU-S7GS2]
MFGASSRGLLRWPCHSVLFDLVHTLDDPYSGSGTLLADESEALSVDDFEVLAYLAQCLYQDVVLKPDEIRIASVDSQFPGGTFQSAEALLGQFLWAQTERRWRRDKCRASGLLLLRLCAPIKGSPEATEQESECLW